MNSLLAVLTPIPSRTTATVGGPSTTEPTDEEILGRDVAGFLLVCVLRFTPKIHTIFLY